MQPISLKIDPLSNRQFVFDTAKINMLTTQIPAPLDKVHIGKSHVHGKGVFAHENIEQGELITFYPGDFVIFSPYGDECNIVMMSNKAEEKYKNISNMNDIKKHMDYRYKFNINICYSIVGDPSIEHHSSYLGHMINDPVKYIPSKMSEFEYVCESTEKTNCFTVSIGDLHLGIVALKNIKKGDELFMSYTPTYWKNL